MKIADFFVTSSNVDIAVYTWGLKPTAEHPRPVAVLAHGFPDRAIFWEKVAQALQESFFVVAYDMRGCGASTPIRGSRHYHYDELLKDLYAVIDAVSPEQPVHLIGHDWGGLYGWAAIAEPEGIRRIASFVTQSPSLEQIGFYLQRRMLRPTPRNLFQLFGQLIRNSLMLSFTLPLLPEFIFRTGMGTAMFRILMKHYEPLALFNKNEGMEDDAIRYLGIYRANLLQRTLLPKRQAPTPVPVHALMSENDPFLPPAVFEDSANWTTRYSESLIEAAHWAPLSQPDAFARAVTGFALGEKNKMNSE
jgi:pimeloyl-ACP methyl ester carboxylesterase